jgi:hypothetical protein
MKIQEDGNEHVVGDRNCPGCTSPEGEEFPQSHGDVVAKCSGLMHAETLVGATVTAGETVVYRCDVCGESI